MKEWELHWLNGGRETQVAGLHAMPVWPHHAHVNSRRSTGCVMSLFTTRGQWTESRTMLSKQCFPLCEGRPNERECVCLCALAYVYMRVKARERLSGDVREWRCANEHAKCARSSSLWGIFSIVFQHLAQSLFSILSKLRVSHVFPNHVPHYGVTQMKYSDERSAHTQKQSVASPIMVHLHGAWIPQAINHLLLPHLKYSFHFNQKAPHT